MPTPAKLKDLVGALEIQPEESTTYYDCKTGETVWVSDEEMGAVEDGEPLDDMADWQKESFEVAREIAEDTEGRFIPLPSQFDIHEYRIMEDFCYSVEDEAASDCLLYAIKGKGAFRRFKDTLHELGIAEQWYAYRDETLKEVAKEWCEAHGIPYIDE